MENIVHGVLFEIPEAQRGEFDAAEGYRQGHDHADIRPRIQIHLGRSENIREREPSQTGLNLVPFTADPLGLNAQQDSRTRFFTTPTIFRLVSKDLPRFFDRKQSFLRPERSFVRNIRENLG
jgi:hypothetical protein